MDAWSVDYDLAHYHSNNVGEKSLKTYKVDEKVTQIPVL